MPPLSLVTIAAGFLCQPCLVLRAGRLAIFALLAVCTFNDVCIYRYTAAAAILALWPIMAVIKRDLVRCATIDEYVARLQEQRRAALARRANSEQD